MSESLKSLVSHQRQPYNMNYELGQINALYHAVLANQISAGDNFEPVKQLQEECARIFALMLHSNLPENISKTIIRRHQRSIYLLLNSIEKESESVRSSPDEHSHSKIELLEHFSSELVQFTNTIREYFPHHADLAHPLSIPEIKVVAEQLVLKFEKISTYYLDQDAIIELLRLTIAKTNLFKIKTSYYQAAYLDELLDKLIELTESPDGHTPDQTINLLIQQGFNTPAFYSYCCIEIIKKRDACGDIAGSYRELFWIQKTLNQILSCKDQQFYSSLPEIRTSLLNFTQAEITHIDNLEKIAADLAGGEKLQENFKVSLSVKELGFFIHLQVECGIIMEERPKKVHEYVVGHYSTKETANISAKSFKNAYYSHAKEDMAKVITKLAEMLALAQRKA